MTRVGPRLRAGCLAFRIRWVEECERKRDEAIASRDEARELRGIAERARDREHQSVCTLDAQIADTERVLGHRGFPHPGGGEHLALAVDNALDTYAARLQMFAESVASHLDVDVQDRERRHYPVRPDTELLERVQDARNGERRYDALRQKMREGLGLHPMATDDALVRAAHERPFGHTRWQAEVIELVGGGRTDSELLARLKQMLADGAKATQLNDELRDRASRVGSPANGGIFEISRERTEQQAEHGYTLQHDDEHTAGQLAIAAAIYLGSWPAAAWPWHAEPPALDGDRVERLAKAGGLIAAEIDRLRRAQNRGLIELDEALSDDLPVMYPRAVSRDGMNATCPMCHTSQQLVVDEHTVSIEDGPGSENPPRTCSGSGVEAEHLSADVGGEGHVVDATIACGCHVSVDASCGDDDGHDGPCWPSPMSLAQRALNAAALNRPDLLAQMRQVWAVVGASRDAGVDPVSELSQVRDALYAAGHPAIRGGFHPGKTVEAVEALVRQHDGTLRDAAAAEQVRRYAEGVVAGRAQTSAEVNRARAVLAPDVDTTGTPLDTVARASIDSNRTLAVAAELRWWSWGRVVRASELLARATDLEPGYAPAPDHAHYRPDTPPRPDIWAADREVEVPF